MEIPKINLKALKKQKAQNFRERLEFIDMYAEWIKKTPNKVWSSQQKSIINLFPKKNVRSKAKKSIKTFISLKR